MRVKKTVIWLLVFFMLLIGCSGNEITENDRTDTAVEQNAADDKTVEAKTIRVAIIDSGISIDAIPAEYIAAGKNYLDEEAGTADTYGHGTAIASIICEESQGQNFVLVPLLDVSYHKGKISTVGAEGMAEIIRDAIDIYDCDIINISGGVIENNNKLEEAVEYAASKKVLIVSAVGNDYKSNPGQKYYPAAYETVVAVGASDEAGERADFSQDWADVYELGVNVPIRLISGKESAGSATSYAAAKYTAKLIKNLE